MTSRTGLMELLLIRLSAFYIGKDVYGSIYGSVALSSLPPSGIDDLRFPDEFHAQNLPTRRLWGFATHAQLSAGHAQPYGGVIGYQARTEGIMTARETTACQPSLTRLTARMAKIVGEEGRAETSGRHLSRVARAMQLDGIVLGGLSTPDRAWTHGKIRFFAMDRQGDAIEAINDAVAVVQDMCERGIARHSPDATAA